MKQPNLHRTKGEWIECGQGTLLHPTTGRQVTLEVVEAKGWGRIFEVYHYSNEDDANHLSILQCVNACEGMADPVNDVAAIKRQRDALLVALKDLFATASNFIHPQQTQCHPEDIPVWERARDTIALCEKGEL